jgi:hypothetical protein
MVVSEEKRLTRRWGGRVDRLVAVRGGLCRGGVSLVVAVVLAIFRHHLLPIGALWQTVLHDLVRALFQEQAECVQAVSVEDCDVVRASTDSFIYAFCNVNLDVDSFGTGCCLQRGQVSVVSGSRRDLVLRRRAGGAYMVSGELS